MFRPICPSRLLGFLLIGLCLWACDTPSSLVIGAEMELVLEGLSAVDPSTVGAFEVWLHTAEGDRISVGRLTDLPAERGLESSFGFQLPVEGPVGISVTLEPPGDEDPQPAPYVLLAGDFQGDRALLTVEGQVTDREPLEPEPGAHSLFTSSNNIALGYPSFENAGIWFFNVRPGQNKHGTREVHVSPLEPSWIYQGWIVRDFGTPDEVWIPFGKFRPDDVGLLSSRDDTGSGPFSGDEDYLNGGIEDVPGDEWTTTTVADQLGFRLPGGLDVPLALDAVDPETGEAVWTHVMTIEPAFDEGEPLYTGRPFLLRPYRNPIGEGRPGDGRVIRFYEDEVPRAQVRIRR
jgi:hypothetical protein